jgi:hypothetical protein
MIMLGVIIFMVLALGGFCIIASDDLTKKTSLSVHSWCIVIFILCAIIGCLFACKDYVRTESIRDYTEGKYRLEEVIYSDTTYVVKKNKHE